MRAGLVALVLGAGPIWAGCVWAGPADWDRAFEACLAGVTTLDEVPGCLGAWSTACTEERIGAGEDVHDGACQAGEAALWEARVARILAAAAERLAGKAGGVDALEADQAAWIAWRDANCHLAKASASAGFAGIDAGACRMQRAVEREMMLEAIVQGNE